MKRHLLGRRPSDRPDRPTTRRRFRLETLEGRRLPATFTVININDSGAGSFRQAITDVNADPSPGQDTISFAIPGANPQVIQPASPLPTITHQVLIDGYSSTQAGAQMNSLAVGDNAVLKIVLDGTNATANANGLAISVGNSVVQGLAIGNFGGSAILLSVGGNDVVQGNFIGTDAAGRVAAPNGYGVNVQSGAN